MDALVRGNQPRTAEYKPSGNGTLAGGKKGSAAGGAYSAYLKKGGAPGEQLEPNLFPEVKWVTVKDGTREPPYLDDRAANYLIDQNVLIINGDFRVFTDMINKWCRELGTGAAVRETVTKAVRQWFQMTLVETVIGIQALQKSQTWNDAEIARATSEEALTAAVMPRYHVYNSVKRELGSKFGKMQGG